MPPAEVGMHIFPGQPQELGGLGLMAVSPQSTQQRAAALSSNVGKETPQELPD